MCGIAGIVHLDGSPIDTAVLQRMTDALTHRGPDKGGYYNEGGVGLGSRRLKIIDLTEASSQPMYSKSSDFVVVFNGEIYNFQEKRTMLEGRGYTFRSSGDLEVLLALYEEFGEDCLSHLRGQFAFALHDRKRQTVFLARDRVGKKPLKYFKAGNIFVFGSEIKALLHHPACPKGMDSQAVYDYLTMMYVPAPETGFTGIRKLPAAHSMTVDLKSGGVAERRYWSLSYASDRTKSVNQWKKELMPILEESVRLRMISDVPLGAFLSGGIDSAAVVALMAKQSSRSVETFSIGTDEDTHNELPDAERIAGLLSTNHHPILLKPDIVHLLPELVAAYEEPFADPSSIPTYLLSRETRKHVTVALNGDGGDENFAGYVRYPILRFSERWARLPSPLHSLIRSGTNAFSTLARTTFAYRCHRFESTIGYPWPKRYLQYLSFFTEEEKQQLLNESRRSTFTRTDDRYQQRTADARSRGDDLLHRAMSMDIDTYLADDLLPKVDLGSMAHSLEARSPLLDHMLLEHTARIPSNLKLHGSVRKWIFKKVLADVLPPETLQKPKKGFRLPLDRWFRTELCDFVQDRLTSRSSPLWTMFDPDAVAEFLAEYTNSSIDRSDHIWALLWLDEWMRQYSPHTS